MGLLRRGICAPHSSDEQFPTTYDANGNICPSISASDRITIGAGLGLCVLILCTLAVFWGATFARNKSERENNESHARSSLQPMVRGEPKWAHSPTGSPSFSQPPSQPSSDSSHSDQTHLSVVDSYGLSAPLSSERFTAPRQPPAATLLEGPALSSPLVIGALPARSSSYNFNHELCSDLETLAQPQFGNIMGLQAERPSYPIKNPPLRINIARGQRAASPTYQPPSSTSPLGPRRKSPSPVTPSSLHAFSPVSPMGAYPPLTPSPPVHMATSPVAVPARAVAAFSRANSMRNATEQSAASTPCAPSAAAPGDTTPGPESISESSTRGVLNQRRGSGTTDLSVVSPTVPVMLAQRPARSTCDGQSTEPPILFSSALQTTAAVEQFSFPALATATSPNAAFSSKSEMALHVDSQNVDPLIRDGTQGHIVTAQDAPDVQGCTASVYKYRSPTLSPVPERLPYLNPEAGETHGRY